MRRNNGGFTLIELIVVIVILGILAVTAAPKFVDLQSDARLATLNGMKAAINSAVSLTYGKSLVKGVEKNATGSKVSINGEEVEVCYGYPCAEAAKIQKVLDIGVFSKCDASSTHAGDWCYGEQTDTKKIINIYIANGYSTSSKCYVTYEQPTGVGVAPKVALPSDVSC